MTDYRERNDAEQRAAQGTVLEVTGLGIDLTLAGQQYRVVRDLSFRIAAGEILGVVGESGSGKSLTALSIARLLPNAARVATGRIAYRGQDLLTLSDAQVTALRGDRIGMVFQDPMAFLNPLMTVGRQIREALTVHGIDRQSADRRAIELLDLVGVRNASQRSRDYPHQFSGGMRQRAVIAMAVANNPDLLIADEPTTALDVTVQAGILRLLRGLRDELGAGLMLVTHDIGVVEQVCDSVLVLYAGRVVEYGTVTDVLGSPRHPYTRELMRATPRLDAPTSQRLPVIPGRPPDVTARPSGCAFHPRCPLVRPVCLTDDPSLVDLGGQTPHQVACWVSDRPLPTTTLPEPGTSAGSARDGEDGDVACGIANVYVAYRTRGRLGQRSKLTRVIHGVDLQVRSGRAVGLVGESGSGKSTLARAIVGLQPIESGVIRIDGVEWATATSQQRLELRRKVQIIFQDPYQSLNPRQTVGAIIAEPLTVHKIVPRASRLARVHELLDLVGMSPSLQGRFPYQLSGGQRQRVGIARALAMEPKVLIADEPLSALDVSVQAQIINLLADLRDRLNLACLIISHDLSVVRHLCEEVAVMQDGRIVEQARGDQIFTNPQHPYTKALLAASPGSPWAEHRHAR